MLVPSEARLSYFFYFRLITLFSSVISLFRRYKYCTKKVVIDFVNYAYLNLRVDVDRVYYKVSILARFSIEYSGK